MMRSPPLLWVQNAAPNRDASGPCRAGPPAGPLHSGMRREVRESGWSATPTLRREPDPSGVPDELRLPSVATARQALLQAALALLHQDRHASVPTLRRLAAEPSPPALQHAAPVCPFAKL